MRALPSSEATVSAAHLLNSCCVDIAADERHVAMATSTT